ncbi:hypothetical protein GmRootV213_05260 [Variovorax sp. V213]
MPKSTASPDAIDPVARPSLKPLYQLLRVASHLLDQAAIEVRENGPDPAAENIEGIGRALFEVIRVQHKIFALQPELEPRSLAASSREAEANQLFSQFMHEAIELEDVGNTAAAVERYTRFIGISPTYHHREIARAEIRRLS